MYGMTTVPEDIDEYFGYFLKELGENNNGLFQTVVYY
jgi:hypothetical protein